MNEEWGQLLTAEVADPPSSTVDVAEAIRSARRIRRRRRLAATGVAAAALVVAVGGAGTVALGGDDRAAPPAGNRSAAPTAREVAPTSFDPTMRTLSIGALPDHLAGEAYQLSDQRQCFRAEDARASNDARFALFVSVLPRGAPAPTGEHGAAGTTAKPVHGRPARCLRRTAQGCAELTFQYLPDAWALVAYHPAVQTASVPRVVRRVAASVRLVAVPVRMPFRLGGTVSRWIPAGATIASGGPNRAFGELSLNEPHRRDRYPQDSVDILVRAHDPNPGGTNTTVDGHPAKLDVDLKSGNGLFVYLPGDASVSIMLRPGLSIDPRDIYRRVHLVDRIGDQDGWVDPLP